MRRQIKGQKRAENDTASRLLYLPLSHDNVFLFASGIILVTTFLFSVVTVYLMKYGYTETVATWCGLLAAGAFGTMMQLTNLWRGRLFHLTRLALSKGTGLPERPNEQGEEQPPANTANLLDKITCSCKQKEQAVGVCHHCGRFVCERCGYAVEDKRFTIPGKPIWKREPAWHCLKCLRKYHESEWRWHWFLKWMGFNRKSKLS